MAKRRQILLITAKPQSQLFKICVHLIKYADIYLFSMSRNFDKTEYEKIGCKIKIVDIMGRQLVKKRNLKMPLILIKFLREFIELKKINPDIVIAEGEPNWPCALARRIFRRKIFVYYPYNITSFSEKLRKKILKIEKFSEKYCFENSDIIMHKGPKDELEWLGYEIKGKQLQFLPACSEEWTFPIKNKSQKLKGMHLVYIGLIPEYSEELQIQWPDQLKIYSKQKIYSHIYPTTKFSDLDDKHIKIYKPLPQQKLNAIMGNYHYGLYTASYKKDWQDKRLMKSTIGNKLFSYFEAGIPVIVEESYEFIADIIRKYNCGIVISEKDKPTLRKILEKQDYNELLKGVERIRKEMAIKNYVNQLIKEIIHKLS